MLLVDDKKEALPFISALIHLQPIKNILDIFDFFDSEISRLIAEIINNSVKLMDSRDAFLFLRALREKFMPEMSPEPSIVAYPSVITDSIGSIIEALERYDEIKSSSARSDFRENVKVILDILPEHIIVKELVSIVLGYLKEAYEEMLLLADGHGLLRSLSRDDSKSTSVNSKDILVTLISNKLFTPVAIDTNLCGVNYLYDARKHQRMPMQLAVQRLRSAPVTEEYAVMQAYTSNVAKLVNPVEVTSIKALCIEAIYDSPDVRKLARDMRDNIASTSTNPSASPSYRINRLPIFFYDCQRRTAYAYTEEQQIADAKSAAITSSSGVAMTATTSSVATTVTTAARK
ncbi:hypothetical protein AYO45_06220 [Gammaproteobacteria bacterium SCGC AG-212-F23]|nr:hypothetical protein AYO45_06220 [Gammaproteobacteria bacterium SCGC AG-212-F23]